MFKVFSCESLQNDTIKKKKKKTEKSLKTPEKPSTRKSIENILEDP